jgi:hypothetical protein
MPVSSMSKDVFRDWDEAKAEHIKNCTAKILTIGELRKALEGLPDGGEVLIPTKGVLWNATGFEVSFFTSKENKHIKLLSDLQDEDVKS